MAKKSLEDFLGLVNEHPEVGAELLKNPDQIRDEYELTEEQMACIAGAGQTSTDTTTVGKYGVGDPAPTS
jgi:hypothetical protein